MVVVFAGGLWVGWLRRRGERGTSQRRAVASMVAIGVPLLGFYAFGESFLLKPDKLVMFCLIWFVALLGNADTNRIDAEFGDREANPKQPIEELPDENPSATL